MNTSTQRRTSAPPVFFLSYPHRSDDEEDDVARFYADLCRNVRQLVGSRVVAGVADRAMAGGQLWESWLMEALRTAQVFVALMCADYAQSQWCVTEWRLFSQRRVIARDRQPVGMASVRLEVQSMILPVVWTPMNAALVPPDMAAIQLYVPNVRVGGEAMRREYEEYGVLRLLQRRSPSYDEIVWHLAKCVANLYHDYEVKPGKKLSPERLKTVLGGKAE